MLTGHTSHTSGIKYNDCKKPRYPTLFDEFSSAVYAQWEIITCYSDRISRTAKTTQSPGKLFNEEELNATLYGNEPFVFVHIDVLDKASHAYGASGEQYKRNLKELDASFLPLIKQYLDTHNATLIISADHGSNTKAKGHSWDTVPLIFYGEGLGALRLPDVAESRDVYFYVHTLLGR